MRIRAPVLIACLLAIASSGTNARDQFSATPLNPADAKALAGSYFAIVRTNPPELRIRGLVYVLGGAITTAETQGKLGGNLREPSDILMANIAPLFARQYGMMSSPDEKPYVVEPRWKRVVAVPTDAPYLLFVQTRILTLQDRGHALSERYWTGVGLRLALVERKTGRHMLLADCYSDTSEHPDLTPVKKLVEDGGRLFHVVADSLAWKCAHRFAEALLLDPGAVPATPPALIDPLADYAREHPADHSEKAK